MTDFCAEHESYSCAPFHTPAPTPAPRINPLLAVLASRRATVPGVPVPVPTVQRTSAPPTALLSDAEHVIDCTDLSLESYAQFLAAKTEPRITIEGRKVRVIPTRIRVETTRAIAADEPHLFDYQRFIVGLAFDRQRFAIFADCGLGKTAMALAYIRMVRRAVSGKVLIVAPLAVIPQWLNEEEHFYGARTIHDAHEQNIAAWASDPNAPQVAITNHDKFHEEVDLGGNVHAVILDESSILKNSAGSTCNALMATFKDVPFRLCLSATPAPNDREEYGTHSTFLGYTRSKNEFLSMFFVNKDDGWVLKPHGLEAFYRYLSGWSVYLRSPAAYGFSDNLKGLPPIEFHAHPLAYTPEQEARLAAAPPAATESMARRIYLNKLSKGFNDANESIPTAKLAAVVDLCRGKKSLVWVEYNKEQELVAKALRNAGMRVSCIDGSTEEEARTQAVSDLESGAIDVLVSKPRILGFGLNLQFVTNQVWSGLTDSYEQFYQAVKRSHRYGAQSQIDIHLPMTPHEQDTYANILAKKATFEEDSSKQEAAFVAHHAGAVAGFMGKPYADRADARSIEAPKELEGDGWRIVRGDSTVELRNLAPNSLDLAVFSPPFASLFTYSDNIADMGNCGDGQAEFALHYEFFLKGLYEAMKPGRIVCCHVSQLSTLKYRDGFVGIRDFRGDIIRLFQKAGFQFFGEWAILKSPQMQAIKEKVRRLAFAQLNSDRRGSSPGFSDFILIMKKPGEAEVKLASPDGPNNDEWIEWAQGVWTGINESYTLNTSWAKADDDVKHICPMNLEVIDRCIRMYSAPGETVLDPFNGIGSTGVVAKGRGRNYLGIELKPEYFLDAAKNIQAAAEAGMPPINELRKAVSERRKPKKEAAAKRGKRVVPAPESPVRGVADGVPERVDWLRAFGNACCPPQVAFAFRTLASRFQEG
jgi:DNA modification methylase/superfamily II DNA or RNA helicase